MSGLDVAEAHWLAALDRNDEIIAQIVDTPARTLAGNEQAVLRERCHYYGR